MPSRRGGVTRPSAEPIVDEVSHVPFRRSRLRILLPVGMLLAVLVPMVVHAMRLDAPASPRSIGPAARTFYVSPDGDDRRDGSSPANAWRSLDRADAVVFKPGDRLLLRGGALLEGAIRFGPNEAGAASAPVIVDSYGGGRATIEATGHSGITVYNTAGIDIRNLVVVGDAAAFAGSAGIKLYSDLPDDRKLDHVVISHVEVTGFRNGIDIGGGRGATGFRNVSISEAVLHGNRDAGLISSGPAFDTASPSYAHEAVSISGVDAYDNRGDPHDRNRPTGNGIVLGSVRGGIIERSTAHDNGSLCASMHGPVGIWAYDSTAVVIQHNVSFRNRTGGHTDGDGFGLDTHTSSSVMQFNLSHDNDGAGYLVYGPPPSGANTDSVVRFNISDNDARKLSSYGGMHLGGMVSRAQIYHNTVVIKAGGPGRPPALALSGQLSGVTIRNNIFMAEGARSLSASEKFSTSQVLLQGNDVFNVSARWLISWGSSSYATLRRWRFATGQERVRSLTTGLSADPDFATADLSGRAADVATAFIPEDRSPLVGRGLYLRALFGVDPGPVDFFGRPIGGSAAIGAAQPAGGH
jgi:hypothetical protein